MATTKTKNRRRASAAEKASKRRNFFRRMGRISSRAFLAVGLTAGAVYGAKAAHRWAMVSPTFAISHVSFTGLHRASADELTKLAGPLIGQNLLTLDANATARALALHPWVKHAQVSRRWPHHLVINVEEYAPAALATLGDLYLVGRTGEPFKRVQAGDVLDLPLITGLTREDYLADAIEVAEQLKAALDLGDAYSQTPYGRSSPLSEIRISEDGYTLVVGKRAQEIHLGSGDIPQKLARLEQVAELLDGRALTAEVIHLENRVRPAWIAVKLSSPASERNRGRTK